MGRHAYGGTTNGRWQRKRNKVLQGVQPIATDRLAALLAAQGGTGGVPGPQPQPAVPTTSPEEPVTASGRPGPGTGLPRPPAGPSEAR